MSRVSPVIQDQQEIFTMKFQLLSVSLLMLATRCVYSVAVGHQPGEDHDHDHDHENDDHDQGEVNGKDHESALTNIEEKLEDKMTLNSLNILLENLNEEVRIQMQRCI
ncbi:unnamed protein product [Clavelina lepadiformis]|uniref:Uncharacterized protein n=1 Tax=Clavelina lepadiformis TaxID=159417 RepID=A0ABP0F4G5_CLALP